jgi:SAM-dependent methyltransferase
VPDAIFAHPRLALVYDAFDGARDDLTAYLGIVRELRASRVVDTGCGTGAWRSCWRGTVAWACGDAASATGFDADLAVMTGNVAQVFITDDDWGRALRAIRGTLRPRGYLVLETRRPERRAWEEWAGSVVTSDSTLRFRGRDETETALAEHGYRVLEVRQAPDRPGREFVFIAERTT